MRRPAALVTFVLTAALAAPAWPIRALTPQAPEIPASAGWINAQPFTLKRLKRRRVVLLAFINVASAHALRSLKALKALDAAYSLNGLMVVGVHTPAYDFQKNPAVVRSELRRRGVEFPVLLDNDRRLWNAYGNEGWPGFYLVDHAGRIIWDLVGETRYEELESELRTAVARVPRYSEPAFPPVLKDPPVADCGIATAELDLGAGRSSVLDLDRLEAPLAGVLTASRQGELSRKGSWLTDSDGLRLNRANRDQSSFVRVVYVGSQAFATLSPGPRGQSRFFVRQDELFLHSGNAGSDVSFDDEGRSFILVSDPRLYHLVSNTYDNPHELTLTPVDSGSVVYGFGFSDQCLKID